ncbi:MAG: hypothetical protein Q4P30_02670 [Eubacteriales bacterium]|nr:hypothetical protein [Eubacteriales bacterium]
MKKYSKIIYIILFVLISLTPLVLIDTTPDKVSEIDNRKYSAFPEKYNRYFFNKVEAYYEDRVGLRGDGLLLFSKLNEILFQYFEHPTYECGEDGYVFFKMSPPVLTEAFSDEFFHFITSADTYLKSRGIDFIYMQNPGKDDVYREKLHHGYTYDNHIYGILPERTANAGVDTLYTLNLLQEAKKTQQVFNIAYDAGHWNDEGRFIATSALYKRIKNHLPDMHFPEKEDFCIGKELIEHHKVLKTPLHEYVPKYVLNNPPPYVDMTDDFPNISIHPQHRYFLHWENPNSPNGKKILYFHGSFYVSHPDFLAGDAAEFTAIHNYENILNLPYYINLFEPDLVVFIASNYTLCSTYYDEDALINTDFNPALDSINANIYDHMLPSANWTCTTSEENPVTLTVSNPVEDGRYAYAVFDKNPDIVYDLTFDTEDSMLELVLQHSQIFPDDSGQIIIINKDGTSGYTMPFHGIDGLSGKAH